MKRHVTGQAPDIHEATVATDLQKSTHPNHDSSISRDSCPKDGDPFVESLKNEYLP
jgi:hypothetical protein